MQNRVTEAMEQFSILNGKQTKRIKCIKGAEEVKAYIDTNRDFLDMAVIAISIFSNAVGLASNQLLYKGKPVTDHRFFITSRNGNTKIFINPQIKKHHGMKRWFIEGCLTWPGKLIFVERYHKVTLEYYTMDYQFHTEEFEGFEAQIVQHEVGHLDGVREDTHELAEHADLPKNEKVGRNEKCPCGSGKKHKVCCWIG